MIHVCVGITLTGVDGMRASSRTFPPIGILGSYLGDASPKWVNGPLRSAYDRELVAGGVCAG